MLDTGPHVPQAARMFPRFVSAEPAQTTISLCRGTKVQVTDPTESLHRPLHFAPGICSERKRFVVEGVVLRSNEAVFFDKP